MAITTVIENPVIEPWRAKPGTGNTTEVLFRVVATATSAENFQIDVSTTGNAGELATGFSFTQAPAAQTYNLDSSSRLHEGREHFITLTLDDTVTPGEYTITFGNKNGVTPGNPLTSTTSIILHVRPEGDKCVTRTMLNNSRKKFEPSGEPVTFEDFIEIPEMPEKVTGAQAPADDTFPIGLSGQAFTPNVEMLLAESGTLTTGEGGRWFGGCNLTVTINSTEIPGDNVKFQFYLSQDSTTGGKPLGEITGVPGQTIFFSGSGVISMLEGQKVVVRAVTNKPCNATLAGEMNVQKVDLLIPLV